MLDDLLFSVVDRSGYRRRISNRICAEIRESKHLHQMSVDRSAGLTEMGTWGLGARPGPAPGDVNTEARDLTDNALIGNRDLHGKHHYAILSAPRHVHELVHIDQKKFRAAARHSRHVRLLRKALPVGVALVLGWLAFKPFRIPGSLQVIPGSVAISGTRITMGSPRYDGFTSDGRQYEVTARAASQDITKPDIVDLNDIWAKVHLQDNATVEMTAVSGVYDSKQDRLTLKEQIILSSSTGYAGRLRDAVVEVKKGTAVSESPVELTLLNGTLSANRLEIEDHGDVIRFGRGVVMNLNTLGER
jgi:lipopolysaccharide export system protein LptC